MSEPLPNLDRDAPGSDDARRRSARLNLRAIITGALFIAIIGLVSRYLARPSPRSCRDGKHPDRHRSKGLQSPRKGSGRAPSGCGGGRDPNADGQPGAGRPAARGRSGTLVGDAELARINVGTRAEIIAQRTAEIDRAAVYLTLAQQTYITEPSSSPPISLPPNRSSTRTATR